MDNQLRNIIFVGEVKKHEVLYNYKHPDHLRKELIEEAWLTVANNMKMSVAECKEKWRNLRTVYIRKIKPRRKQSKEEVKPYYLAEAMKFCLPFIRVVSPISKNKVLPAQQEKTTNEAIFSEIMCIKENVESSSSLTEPSETLFQHNTYNSETEKIMRLHTNIEETVTTNNKIDRKECLTMFLLSLLPELEELSDSQIKIFKRKVLFLIDELSSSNNFSV